MAADKTNRERDPVLTIQALKRMPYYLTYLKKARDEGKEYISAPVMASELALNDVLVRKDIAAVSSKQGIPKTGFEIGSLIKDIEDYMGYHVTKEAVLVGAGSLGRALLRNKEFAKYGFRFVAAFDVRRSMYHKLIDGIEVLPASKMSEFLEGRDIRFGVITVPAEAAQKAADKLVKGGVRAIWNFAPVKLTVPSDVLVHNEDLASSLAMLSQHLMP